MILDSQTIRGMLRFDEPLTIPYRDLPSGLVAFVGGNGEGKSASLEAPMTTFFGEWPSRADWSIYDFVTRSDAYLETTFTLEGQGVYTCRRNLDGPRRTGDAVLTMRLPDGQIVFLNDLAKIKTYDAAIAQLLPPQALMLASVFAAQNRQGAFSKLDRKGKGELFSALLGLEHLIELGGRAKSAAGLVQIEIDKLTVRRQALSPRADATVEEALERRAQQVQAEGGQLELEKRLLDHDVRNIEQQIIIVADAAARHAVAVAREAQLAADLTARASEAERLLADLRRVDVDLGRDRQLAEVDLTKRLSALADQIADRSCFTREIHQADETLRLTIADTVARIANNRTYLADGDAIRASVAEVAKCDAALATFRDQLERSSVELAGLLDRERALQHALQTITDAERDLQKVRQALDVPCSGEGVFASCQFLTDAGALRDRVPGLADLVASKATTLADAARVRSSLVELRTVMETLRHAITDEDAAQKDFQAIANDLPKLTQAEERIVGLEQRQREARAAHVAAREQAEIRQATRIEALHAQETARKAEHEEDLARLDAKTEARRQDLRAAQAAVEEAIVALAAERTTVSDTVVATASASATAAEQHARLTLKRRDRDTCLSNLARVEAERQELARRVEDARAMREEVARVDGQIAALTRQHVDWTLLAKALGRDGLPVLEIDAAGPTVSAFTNDLLHACYGGRFSLELVTQVQRTSKAKSGETMKDGFEILVYDSERGGDARELGQLSGGEQVIVDECLRSGIALFAQQRSPIPLRTCWRDECTGALDVENGPRYMAMLRRLQELGGYHHVIAIIHNPEWAALADAQVCFAGGRVAIELPPYGRAEEAA